MSLDEKSIVTRDMMDLMKAATVEAMNIAEIQEWNFPKCLANPTPAKTAALRRAKWRAIRRGRFR